jgi:hypothetical protein
MEIKINVTIPDDVAHEVAASIVTGGALLR